MWASSAGRSPATAEKKIAAKNIESIFDLIGQDWSYSRDYGLRTLAWEAGTGRGGRDWFWTGTTGGTQTTAGTLAAALLAGEIIDAGGNGWFYDLSRPLSLSELGGLSDGVADDAAALNGHAKAVHIGPGKTRIAGPVEIGQSQFFHGEMPPGTNPQSGDSSQSYLIHDFDGPAFDFQGTADDLEGAGGGLKNISIVQAHGAGAGESGNAIQAIATASRRPNWLKFENLNIEEQTGKNGWQWGAYIDGSAHANSIRNIWFDRCRFVAGALASGAVSLRGVANAFVNACMGNLENGNIEITGGSASVMLNGSTFAGLIADNVTNLWATGGSYESIETTANTINAVFSTTCTSGEPVLSGTLNYFCGLDQVNSRYLFKSSGSPFVFKVPGGSTWFVGENSVADDVQITVEGRYNGYGAGVRAVSRTSSGGPVAVMGRIDWQGTAPWDGDTANQDSKAVVTVSENGAELTVGEFRAPAAGETGFLLLHGGTVKRVTVGAEDSGGTGHRVLRVVN